MDFLYAKYKNKVPDHLVKQGCTPFNLLIPAEKGNGPVCLVIVGHINKHDIKAGRLFSTSLDKFAIGKLKEHAKAMAKRTGKDVKDYRFAFINFNHHRNYHLKGELRHESVQFSVKRIHDYIDQLKPDCVLVAGDSAAQHLLDPKTYNCHGIKQKIKVGEKTYPAVSTLEISNVLCGADEEIKSKIAFARSNLFGYLVRNTATVFLGKQLASISKIVPNPILINSIKKFDRMMDKIEKAPAVAVDTETTSLEVLHVEILTIQFAISPDEGYVVPINHKDSPFDGKQLKHIRDRLYKFFTQKTKTPDRWKEQQYLLTQRGQYDFRVIRHHFKIPVITLPVYDCFHPDTWIETDRGKIQIKDAKIPGLRIKSFNHATSEVEWQPLVTFESKPTTKKMLEIEYEGGTLIVTEDHKIWSATRNEYICAKDLTDQDEILILA